jgi:hypothetical protein
MRGHEDVWEMEVYLLTLLILTLDEDACRLVFAGYFLSSLFLQEDGDNMLLRNVSEL